MFSKAKVRPLNKNFDGLSLNLTIPRMELLSCVIGGRASVYVRKAFPDHAEIRMRHFTDSLITLYRIQNDPGLYKVWTGRRLVDVQQTTKKEDWFFISGEQNFAADAASRGAKISEFIENPAYLHGPPCLLDPNHVYLTADSFKLSQAQKQLDSAERKAVTPTFHLTFVSHHLTTIDEKQLGLEAVVVASNTKSLDFYEKKDKSDPSKNGLLYRFQSWAKTVKILAWVFRFVHHCQSLVKSRKKLVKMYDNSANFQLKLRRKRVKPSLERGLKVTIKYEKLWPNVMAH